MIGGISPRDFFLGKSESSSNQSSTSATSNTSSTSFYTGMELNSSSKLGIYVKQILSYLFGIAIVIFIIMLFIHFFITPIFSLQPGAPGIFVVPGLDDGVLFWNKSNPAILPNRGLPIQNMDYGYSFIIDLFIEKDSKQKKHC
jgi:hypothetical protein